MKKIINEIKNRQRIIDQLKSVFESPAIREVVISFSPNGSIPGYNLCPWPRILLPLNKTFWFRYYQDGIKEKIIQPGQLLFCASFSILAPVPGRSYNVLGISYCSDFIRYLITDYSSESGCAYHDWYNTSLPVSNSGNHIIQSLQEQYSTENRSEIDKLLIKSLIYLSMDELKNDGEKPECGKAFSTYQLIKTYVNENFHNHLSRKLVAQKMGLSSSHISKLFNHFSKESFNDYIQRVRMEKAIVLIKDLKMNINEIAYLCGFKNISHFIRIFKKTFGTSPGKYRDTTMMKLENG